MTNPLSRKRPCQNRSHTRHIHTWGWSCGKLSTSGGFFVTSNEPHVNKTQQSTTASKPCTLPSTGDTQAKFRISQSETDFSTESTHATTTTTEIYNNKNRRSNCTPKLWNSPQRHLPHPIAPTLRDRMQFSFSQWWTEPGQLTWVHDRMFRNAVGIRKATVREVSY